MTFRNLLKRSSSENDGLDQALNAWVTGERHSERSEESRLDDSGHQSEFTYALEFHRWAEEARRSDPAASGPAADTWNRVLRNTAQAKSRGEDMNSAAMNAAPYAAIVYDSRPFNRGQIARYLNYAASLLIVFGVAFAGAFMAMQMNQPDDSSGQFALFSQTDDSATCDVEPLSVDRVMEIVKNPVPFVMNGPGGEPTASSNAYAPWAGELYEADLALDLRGERMAPVDEEFESAGSVADAYIQCVVTGTVAQAFTFWHPVVIQEAVLMAFPVFADEESVREMLKEELPKPVLEADGFAFWADVISAYEVGSIGINPHRELALQQESLSSYAESVITFGISINNREGDTVLLVSATGNQLVSRDRFASDMLVVTLAKSRSSDNWYVVSHFPYA